MSTPLATARLQLNAGFTLADACEQVPYYAAMGVSHLYFSPITQAVPGSMHGYDVTDPTIVSPELGGEAAFAELAQRLRAHRMGIVLDIVPNHMAAHAANRWWWDVLLLGQASAYADWFDIDWNSEDPELKGKVLAPFLAQSRQAALDCGTLSLVFDDASRSFQVQAEGARYPLTHESLPLTGDSVAQTLAQHDCATQAGRMRFEALLDRQHYVLDWWRCAGERINWRRFFEISSLIGVRVERRAVFDAVHALPLRLFAQGLIDGVRIDHVDGLAQPLSYCRQLRTRLRAGSVQRPDALRHDEPWMVVEKILAHDEVLDGRWAVHGTTGYDFMDQASAVLHDPDGETVLADCWSEISNVKSPAQEWLIEARQLMLNQHFAVEYRALLRALWNLVQFDAAKRGWTLAAIDRAMQRFLSVFPIYRTYLEEGNGDSRDIGWLLGAAAQASQRFGQGGDASLCMLLDGLFRSLSTPMAATQPQGKEREQLRRNAINRLQQLTPPLAAKSLEDTVFYRYGRLLSRNEVGSDLSDFSLSSADFHRRNVWRLAHMPESMVSTATHDQKRGEDSRARLAVISEMPGRWAAASQRWLRWAGFQDNAKPVHTAERYMLMQTIVGSWPLDLSLDDAEGLARYTERLAQWQVKALREAKTSSSWFTPDLRHEERCVQQLRALMLGDQADMRADIQRFIEDLAPAGAVNSLAQLVLRMTVPGVPDLYQGTEFWDFSLVDPDNRRQVDFRERRRALEALQMQPSIEKLLAGWRNGRIKQTVIARVLRLRRQVPHVFARGGYTALLVAGEAGSHAIAFLRAGGDDAVLVVVPRLCWHAMAAGKGTGLPLIGLDFWRESYAQLPVHMSRRTWLNALTGEEHYFHDVWLPLETLLGRFPVAVLHSPAA